MTACSILTQIKSKSNRLVRALEVMKSEDLKLILTVIRQELIIYNQDSQALFEEMQTIINSMERGLINRRQFLINNNLEKNYQTFKINQKNNN